MHANTKILVIEDEEELRKSIVEILEFEGFDVVDAGTGNDGINLLRTEKPDIILCDILLPDIEGYQVIEVFKNEPRKKAIPFIFITALFDREHFRMGMECGADDYLVKPFSREELLKSIATQQEKITKREALVNQEIVANAKADRGSGEIAISDEEKENVSKLVHEALAVLDTSNSIQELIDRIDKELRNEFLTDGIRHVLNDIKRQVSQSKDFRKEHTLFLLKFNLIHPSFIVNLKKEHPKLSSNEVFMASATLMGLDTNQIADMMHISVDSVRKNRYRLKKKLELSKEADFFAYIQSFV